MQKSVHRSYLESSKELDRIRGRDLTASTSNLWDDVTSRKSSIEFAKPIDFSKDPRSPVFARDNIRSPIGNTSSQSPKYVFSPTLSETRYSPATDQTETSRISRSSPLYRSPSDLHSTRYGLGLSSYSGARLDSTTSLKTRYTDLDYEQIAHNSASNVVSTFRNLQLKVKSLEKQRMIAVEECTELKSKIQERKKELSLWKKQSEMTTTDEMVQSKTNHEKLKLDKDNYEIRIVAQEDIFRSIAKNLTSQRELIESITEDITESEKRIHQLEKRNRILTNELQELKDRSITLQEHLEDTYEYREKKRNIEKLRYQVSLLDDEIDEVEESNERAEIRCGALERYMKLILQINGDLCDTLIIREETKAKILRMAGKYAPPRYTWPKKSDILENPKYEDIIDVVSGAATASALEKRAEKTAIHVSKALKQLSRSRSNSVSLSTRRRNSISSLDNNYNSNSNSNSSYSRTPRSQSMRRGSSFSSQRPRLFADDEFLDATEMSHIRHITPTRENVLTPGRPLSPGELLEQNAAKAVASATAASLALRRSKSRQDLTITTTSSSRRGRLSRSASPARSFERHHAHTFIPSSSSGKSKEFNQVALESMEDREALHSLVYSSPIKTSVLS